MFISIRREKLVDFVLLLGLLFAAFMLVSTARQVSMLSAGSTDDEICLVIDPGHGGIDGGAIAFNGVRESDINLAIGLKLHALADFLGARSVLTRDDDSSRTDAASYSEHEDLVYRTDLINAVPNAVLISIHQNFYPTSQPSGGQVLYASGAESRSLGEKTQSNLVSLLQPDNRRLSEPASKRLYLTSHVNCPAILVECGFLSNLTDLDLLSKDEYQTSLAAVLLISYLQFLSDEIYT